MSPQRGVVTVLDETRVKDIDFENEKTSRCRWVDFRMDQFGFHRSLGRTAKGGVDDFAD